MSNAQLLQEALQLNPQERYLIVERVDAIWAIQAEKRLQNYRDNNARTIPFVF